MSPVYHNYLYDADSVRVHQDIKTEKCQSKRPNTTPICWTSCVNSRRILYCIWTKIFIFLPYSNDMTIIIAQSAGHFGLSVPIFLAHVFVVYNWSCTPSHSQRNNQNKGDNIRLLNKYLTWSGYQYPSSSLCPLLRTGKSGSPLNKRHQSWPSSGVCFGGIYNSVYLYMYKKENVTVMHVSIIKRPMTGMTNVISFTQGHDRKKTVTQQKWPFVKISFLSR